MAQSVAHAADLIQRLFGHEFGGTLAQTSYCLANPLKAPLYGVARTAIPLEGRPVVICCVSLDQLDVVEDVG